MASKRSIQLGRVQESLLVPLYGRALDSLKKRPILKDPKAVEIVESLDWNFQRFNQRRRMVAAALRTALFDEWVKSFLSRHPEGTVVEIGAGLNTRFERLDNGAVHWFDLDLPDTVELRRKFFTDSTRRVTLAASVLDPDWMAAVRQGPGPYFFVSEAVFIYLREPEVKAALAQIAANFPHASIAFDTATLKGISHENKDHAHRKLGARFSWACQDPGEIERWKIGLRLVESRPLLDIPDSLRPRLSLSMRVVLRLFAKLLPMVAKTYRLNLFAVQSEAQPAANGGLSVAESVGQCPLPDRET
jgi:O-methyltransferase involved in polyketide biosynthesis